MDARQPAAYGSRRTAEREVTNVAQSTSMEQFIKGVEALSNEEVEQLAKVVRRERKRRGLLPGKSREADQGQSNRGGQAG